MPETSESEFSSVEFVHWSSVELETLDGFDSRNSSFSKSVDFNLTIRDKKRFKRCVYDSISAVGFVLVLILLLHVWTHEKETNVGAYNSKNLTLALNQALLFFDAQKCTTLLSGILPENNPIIFRGNSGLDDGKEGNINADLVGGFYDSGNNIKFSFSTAYTVTLLSWTVVEYGQKYAYIGELDHIKDIIKWGSDYLLKLFIPPNSNSNSAILYSQVGGNNTNQENDINCWQRPEDMKYPRPVSICDDSAADLAGEIVAGMSAASLVFADNKIYSGILIRAAENLFALVTRQDPSYKPGMYTENDACGGQARKFYNSSGYVDELVWAGTWLFFATGNTNYLKYATDNFVAAEEKEMLSEKWIFDWNNKLTANAILMTRIRYFIDLGYPYEDALSTNKTDLLMCTFLSSNHKLDVTNGGLALLKPGAGAPLQYAATASFLSKLYSDYLQLLGRKFSSCCSAVFTVKMLHDFGMSQLNYILGDNPMKMSYLVGYGDHFPKHVRHRGASIPWDDLARHSCSEGNVYLNSQNENPNKILGAMVGGPDKNDIFSDNRNKPWFTEPSISSNAGLVAALIALHDPPISSVDRNRYGGNLGIDKMGMFQNVHLT
ncbi:endoglucanase 7 [Phtheirospermum japonicum]|uniref:cellulase n=1 Tax=Phtheirospermum japonicum TaxID=374723 RepID=A0A830CU22_9LAMI|nr:endoglucanase 7 [Phtheirospermum japonicum]